MKKYLFILAGLLCLIGQGEAEAKAVKLGRVPTNNKGHDVVACTIQNPNCKTCNWTGCDADFCFQNKDKKAFKKCYCLYHPADDFCTIDGPTQVSCGTLCEADSCSRVGKTPFCTRCKDGFYAVNGVCTQCPAHSQPDGNGGCTCDQGYFKDTQETGVLSCLSCNSINVPHADTSNHSIQCDKETGKVTSVYCSPSGGTYYYEDYSYASNNYQSTNPPQNICREVQWDDMTCADGYRKAPAGTSCPNKPGSRKCIPMCQGVTCVGGFAPTVKNGKCCCELKTAIEHCTAYDEGMCTQCQPGYYIEKSTNRCVACGAHSSCNGSSEYLTCQSGYFVTNWSGCYQSWSSCELCPANASCGFGVHGEGWHCNPGYYATVTTVSPGSCVPDGNGGYTLTKPQLSFGCSACSSGCAQCTGANSCTVCNYGYTLVSGRCFKLKPLYTCLPGMVWHPALRRCTYPVCVANCAEPDQMGCQAGYCTSCMPGYYLTSNGGCASCGSVTPHCTRCGSQFGDAGQFGGKGCTACAKGYRLVGGVCQPLAIPLPVFEDMLVEANEGVSFSL